MQKCELLGDIWSSADEDRSRIIAKYSSFVPRLCPRNVHRTWSGTAHETLSGTFVVGKALTHGHWSQASMEESYKNVYIYEPFYCEVYGNMVSYRYYKLQYEFFLEPFSFVVSTTIQHTGRRILR